MNWTLDPTKVDSLNDSAFRKLLIGTHDYLITKAEVFAGNGGQQPQILFGFENGGLNYSEFLDVMSENATRAEIANKTVKAFMDAVGFTGNMTVQRLASFKGKRVSITTTTKEGTDNNGNPITRVNIKTVDPVSAAPVASSAPTPAPQAEYIAPAPEPVEAPPSDAAPVTTPAATAPGATPPWKKKDPT